MDPQNNEPPIKSAEPSNQPIDTSQLFQKDPEPITSETSKKTAMFAGKKKLLILIAIPIALIISGGLAFAFLGNSNNSTSDSRNTTTSTEQQTDSNQQTTEADAIAENAADQTSPTEDTTTSPSSNITSGSDTTTGGTSGGGTSGGGTNDNPTGTTTSPKTYDISYTNSCFSPADLTIKFGDTIKFVNSTSNKNMWPASDSHPSHTIYPEFDPEKDIAPGSSWSFMFGKTGSWDYHDHNKPGCTGTITVN